MPTIYTIIDIETHPFTHRITEIAAIRINNLLEIIEEFEVRTNVEWDKNIKGKYKEAEAIEILKNIIQEDDIVIGYQIDLIEKILGFLFKKKWDIGWLGKKELKMFNPNLSAMATVCGIKEIDKDRALGDCLTMYDILQKVIRVKVR